MEVICMKFNKHVILSLGVILMVAFLVACAAPQKAPIAKKAETKKEAADWKFHSIVDAAFVKSQVKIPMPENVMLIDSRPFRGKFIKGHIPMAVSIPDSKFDSKKDMLPKDKKALLIFYCQGPT